MQGAEPGPEHQGSDTPRVEIQDRSTRQERQEKVWSVRGSIQGRRRRQQEEKATAEAGTGLRQRERMERGGEGEGTE